MNIPNTFLEYVEATPNKEDFPDWKIQEVEGSFIAHKDLYYFDESIFVKVAIKCCHNTTTRES
ncbi:hypothetical protein [Fictibacillus barbaricus]|uniref:Uncharacterized protein n=1 Tax=Fictibacillus barbaricus TaxID=182136 RepID=A0ABS2ZES4_9BACL|nr:hypothetical protein [Fictibacillus barbaricus]MBN3546697.1 hypothetical protein [Fictibacillus barbaricus]GGB43097.1 hypothetical protein GCM10007199_05510 [Fictibacillus barbaricus]